MFGVVHGADGDQSALLGQCLDLIVGEVSDRIDHAPGSRMGRDDRFLGGFDGLVHGLVRGMGQVHQDPQAVALPHHFQAEVVQSQVVVVQDPGAGIGPGGGERMSQLQAPEAQPVVSTKGRQVLDHDAAVHAQHQGELSFRTVTFQIIRGASQLHLGMSSGRLVDSIDFPKETLDGVRAGKNAVSDDISRRRGGVPIVTQVSYQERLGNGAHTQNGHVDPIGQQGRRIEGGLRFLGKAEKSRRDRGVDDHVPFEDRADRIRLRGFGSGTGTGRAQQQDGQRGSNTDGMLAFVRVHGQVTSLIGQVGTWAYSSLARSTRRKFPPRILAISSTE